MKIIERTHNLETGEVIDIEREETETEKTARLQLESEAQLAEEKANEIAAARNAILDKLGLTEEEAKLLIG